MCVGDPEKLAHMVGCIVDVGVGLFSRQIRQVCGATGLN